MVEVDQMLAKRRCRKCGEWKTDDCFYKNLNPCKLCKIKYQREYDRRPEIKERRSKKQSNYKSRPGVKERLREHLRVYRQKPEIKMRERIDKKNRLARKKNMPNTLTTNQWQHALDYFNGCCAVCGRQLNDMFGEFTVAADHWIPLSYKGKDNPGTVASNIIPLCHGIDGCNNIKKASMPDEWLQRRFGKRKAKRIAAKIQEYFDNIESGQS